MSTLSRHAISILALALLATGCSGARSHVVADSARYPISLSDGVRDQDGKLLPDEQKQVVGGFTYSYRAWGWLWRIVSFTGDHDISDAVNEQVAAANGDAIVNMSVKGEMCLWNLFTIVGVLPDCSNVRVRGHIIKAAPPTGPQPGDVEASAPSAALDGPTDREPLAAIAAAD